MKNGSGSEGLSIRVKRPLVLPVVLMGCFGGDAESRIPRPALAWSPEAYVAFRIDTSVVVDGMLDDPQWSLAPWTSDFVDIQGDQMPTPRYRTRAKILWDSLNVYFAAEMEEPHVWASLTERDAVIYHDNDFEIFIDPDGDTHNYYELEVNAFGTEWDLMLLKPYRDGAPAIDSWDIQGLATAIAVDGTLNDPTDMDRGWTVEIAIPWNVLAEAANRTTPPEDGDQWRLNFSRVQWQTTVENDGYVKLSDPVTGQSVAEDNWVWSPQGLINMHYPEMWGVVEFSTRSVGSAIGQVEISAEEIVRHDLYELYYQQRDWRRRRGRWARTLSELGALDKTLPGFQTPPTIEVTGDHFQITRRGPDGVRVHINEQGRSWIERR